VRISRADCGDHRSVPPASNALADHEVVPSSSPPTGAPAASPQATGSAHRRTVTAVALDSGELACRQARIFARHRTITALEHARALRAGRRDRRPETPVEVRLLARYDALIA
jgi:hypothetical protein